MKKIIAFICAAAFLAMACEKEEPIPTPDDSTNPSDTTQVDPSSEVFIPNAVTDFDGNSYDAVRIGNQVWMASNLRTTHFPNGDAIPGFTTSSNTDPYYVAGVTDVVTHGLLYNWPAVMHGASSSNANPSGVQGVCPDGWHVPSYAEWMQLNEYCGTQSDWVCGGEAVEHIAKSLASDTLWRATNKICAIGNDLTANNASGFSAMPSGYFTGSGFYGYLDIAGFWTTTAENETSSLDICLLSDRSYMYINDSSDKYIGYSVRCVRD
ncbi:MAG: fibrobacter succinogenes major paralogous domain-containing protein [Bacteroidales bacterium]|nr:fibrobacter succinogenes major paralogous domain-containing protein [Bacteroidales bacterium]